MHIQKITQTPMTLTDGPQIQYPACQRRECSCNSMQSKGDGQAPGALCQKQLEYWCFFRTFKCNHYICTYASPSWITTGNVRQVTSIIELRRISLEENSIRPYLQGDDLLQISLQWRQLASVGRQNHCNCSQNRADMPFVVDLNSIRFSSIAKLRLCFPFYAFQTKKRFHTKQQHRIPAP